MAISRPALAQLNSQAQSDQISRIDGLSPTVRRSLFGAIATVVAGLAHGLYGFFVRRSLAYTPFTARGADLDGWLSLYKLPRKQPQAATGSIVATGAAQAVIPAGSEVSVPGGATFTTNAAAVLDNTGAATIAVTAEASGSAGNLPAGTVVSFISPPSGVSAQAIVGAPGIGGGADLETDDQALARLVQRLSSAPQGGSKADYEEWALQVPNITRAWCFPTYSGPGTVLVYVADDSYQGAGLASDADVAAVKAYIEPLKPAGVATTDGNGNVIDGLTVSTPTKTPVAINASVVPNTAAVQASVQANLAALFAAAQPEGTIKLHQIYKAFLDASGLSDFTLTAPAADQTAAAGQVLSLGAVTFA